MSANSDKENKEPFGFPIIPLEELQEQYKKEKNVEKKNKIDERSQARFIRLQDDYYYAFNKDSEIFPNKDTNYLTKELNNFIDSIKRGEFDEEKLNDCYSSIDTWFDNQYPSGGHDKIDNREGFERDFTLHIARMLVNQYCNENEICDQCLEKSDKKKYKILKTKGFFDRIKIGKKHIFSKTATLKGEINRIYNDINNNTTYHFGKLLKEFYSECQKLKTYRERRNKNCNPAGNLSIASNASKSNGIIH